MKWKNAYIFISSTFNDMHAERDLLVKRVFPELRLWCSKRKIKLIDIDLRWGVSEEDAVNNKKVVDICLKNIDKCRPFFLCFLGQRRGWVPQISDIHPETFNHYPKLAEYIGKQSITELEIIHALLEPLENAQVQIPTPLFYFRNPNYLTQISDPDIYSIYSSKDDDLKQLKNFKSKIENDYSVFEYDTLWDHTLTSYELKGIGNTDLTRGRLTHFTIEEESLAHHTLEHLKEAISKEFPEHIAVTENVTSFQKELDWQDSYMNILTDTYIRRPSEEKKLLDYIYSNDNNPYILEANAGTGKTSLLAYILTQLPSKHRFYRFIGTSQESSDLSTLMEFLYEEFVQAELLNSKDYQDVKNNTVLNFYNVLAKISEKQKKEKHPFVLVLDAIDQFRFSEELPYWIPTQLPENIRLIISLKTDADAQRNQYLHHGNYVIHTLHEMNDDKDKKWMIEEYLGQYLKSVDQSQIQLLLAMKGSSNPLYLKIVLNELRIHGSFESLKDKLSNDYGSTPQDAFSCVLERMEQDTILDIKCEKALIIIFLTMMAYSLEGLDIPLTSKLLTVTVKDFKNKDEQQITDALYVIAKHLSPYLVIQGKQVDFLYESLRIAVKKRYHSNEKLARAILAFSYRLLLNRHNKTPLYNKGKDSNIVSLAHQVINHSIKLANTELLSPWFMYEYCKRLGATALASQYYAAARIADNGYAYEEIANALIRIPSQVSVNPQIVFYELKKILGTDNDIFNQILKNLSQMPGYFFRQNNKIEESLQPQKEICKYGNGYLQYFVHSEFISHKVFESMPDGNHKSSIVLQNIFDGKIEKIIKFPFEYYDLDTRGDYIYTGHSDNGKHYNIYEIPSMKQISSGDYPPCPEGFHWATTIHGWKNYVFGICCTKADQYKAVNLHTGQILWEYTQEEPDAYCTYTFFGRLLYVSILHVGIYLIDLVTGQEIWRQNRYGYSDFMSDDENAFLLYRNDTVLMCLHIDLSNDQIILAESKEMKPYIFGDSYAVINGHLLVFIKNQMWVFDKNINCLGYQMMPDEMVYIHKEKPVLHKRGDYVFYLTNDSIKYYSIDKLFSNLKQNTEKVTIKRLRNQMFYNKYLYLFYEDGSIEKINPETGKIVASSSDITVKYNSDTLFSFWGTPLLVGSRNNSFLADYRNYSVCMQTAHNLSTIVRYNGQAPDGMYLHEAFFLDGKVGLIFLEPYQFKKDRILFAPDGSEVKFTTSKCLIQFTSDFQNFEEWNLNWECAGYIELFSYENELYVLFEELYIDDYHIGARIYNIRTRECVCECILTANHHMYCTDAIQTNGCYCIYIRKYDYEQRKNHRYIYVLDFLTGSVSHKKFAKYFNIEGNENDHIYLAETEGNSIRQSIMIMSAKTMEFEKVIPCNKVKASHAKIIRKYGAYLVYYVGGTIEIYTDDSNGPLFSQLLVPGHILDCPGTDKFIIVGDDNRYYVYSLDQIRNLSE